MVLFLQFLLTLLALVNLATSFPTTPLGESPVKLANEATTAKTDVTTGSAALTTSTTEESREKREARRYYDEEESRRKFIASAAFAVLG